MIRTQKSPVRKTAKPLLLGLLAAFLALFVVFGLFRFNFCNPMEISWLRDIPVAHRGLHSAQFDENSMGAFENAVRNGYAIEFDLRLTKDGIPVVFHDDDVLRVTGQTGKLSEMLLADVRKLKLPKSGESIPTFQELLDAVHGRVPLLVEVKNYGFPGKLEEETLKLLQGYRGKVAVQSYNPMVVNWFRRHAPDIAAGLLLNDLGAVDNKFLRRVKDNLFTAMCSPNFLAYNYDRIDGGMMDVYRGNNVIVLGYVIKSEQIEPDNYISKVDNIIFEIIKSQ